MTESSNKKTFFWKGKRVTEKVYNSRIRQVEVGKNLRSVYGCKNEKASLKESAVEIEKLEGRRIMHLKTVSNYLFCKYQKCSAMVPLSNTVDETRIGLASILIVQCQVCQGKTRFATDKTHRVKTKNAREKSSNHYDVNTRVAMGALNGGMGNTHINKLLASLNIPPFHVNCYKTYEIEVGAAVEEMAQDSCIAATLLERELSIQNVDKLKNLL